MVLIFLSSPKSLCRPGPPRLVIDCSEVREVLFLHDSVNPLAQTWAPLSISLPDKDCGEPVVLG
jgi:hypothetical protein